MPQSCMAEPSAHLKVGGMGHESLQALAPDWPDPRIMLAIDQAGGARRVCCQLAKTLGGPRGKDDGHHCIHCQLVLRCCQDIGQQLLIRSPAQSITRSISYTYFSEGTPALAASHATGIRKHPWRVARTKRAE